MGAVLDPFRTLAQRRQRGKEATDDRQRRCGGGGGERGKERDSSYKANSISHEAFIRAKYTTSNRK